MSSEEIKYDPNRKKLNLFEDLVRIRDEWREQLENATPILRGTDIPIELSRWGLIQWYVHPSINDTVHKSLMVWVMHIPPKSRTGKIRYKGGQIFYVWQGTKGHTVVDGQTHEWGAKCMINLPMKSEGIVFQHFNDGDDEVRLLGSEPNFVHSLGLDKGADFDVIEPCPQWLERSKK
jgi:hypothetical protein